MSPQQWLMLQYMMGQGGSPTMADLLQQGGFQMAGDVTDIGRFKSLDPANEDFVGDLKRWLDYGGVPARLKARTPGAFQSPGFFGPPSANDNSIGPLAMYFLNRQTGGYS